MEGSRFFSLIRSNSCSCDTVASKLMVSLVMPTKEMGIVRSVAMIEDTLVA